MGGNGVKPHVLSILSLGIFYMYHTNLLWWLFTVPNLNNIHKYTSEISLHAYIIYEIMCTTATFWHRAQVYFICIKPLLWLITVSNVNNINTFSSEISNKYIKFMKFHNYSNVAWSQILFYLHKQNMVSNCCTKYEQNQSILL